MRSLARLPKLKLTLAVALPLALLGAARVPWSELTEADWMYALATRFSVVEGHRVHYPTPPEELAKLLEARKESAALRQLADTRLELGDRPGALAAMNRWAEAEGPGAWAETARWAMAHQEVAMAFRAAEHGLQGLPEPEKRRLADERVQWADRYPEQADPMALRRARAELFPQDAGALEDWLRKLEKANRLEEADRALAASRALGLERALLLRADLLADHGNPAEAFKVLDQAVPQPWSIDLRKAYAARVDRALPSLPGTWRATLERGFEAPALVRLATYFQGKGRGDAVLDLLRQMERRHEASLTRPDHQLLGRLYAEIDATPEAFRATLAAAHLGNPEDQKRDLALLSRLALQAAGRPLALGSYNDETYHWAAQVDRTPGFWTGGASFLLTGLDWKETLAHLESESLPDRTFTLARALADELARREARHPELPTLRIAIMERHVERGEGQAALALLPQVESASPGAADQGRRIALLAMRQVEVSLPEELRLMKARLRFLAPDGSQPGQAQVEEGVSEEVAESRPWARQRSHGRVMGYAEVLEESLARLESRDRSHVTSLGLILGEMDRMPNAEALWMTLAAKLEGWNLDDELGPRYEQALQRFQGSGIWSRSARWYAHRSHHGDLRRLASEVASRFRGAAIFERAQDSGEVRVEIPEQPPVAGRVRMVLWADWVRLRALERFPHSPTVYREAQRLVTQGNWARNYKQDQVAKQATAPVVVADSLMEERRWALLFTESNEREAYFSEAMAKGTLEAKLLALDQHRDRTPVEELLLFEGWARLSRFEQATDAADRLAQRYPGDGALAQRVLSLHRSLNGLDPRHGAPARALVERTAPALVDAAPLWTELGELEEERGRPEAAILAWQHIVQGEPRNPQRISELATLLWDYGHDAEALVVVEEGRKRLDRPRFYAFETGVLRENLKDLEGAVREYLDAVRPEGQGGYGSFFEQDQRSLRRLAQLLARDRVYRIVERRIQGLKPGNPEDERALAAFLPLAGIEPPVPGQSWDADAWIDAVDQPNDPLGREARSEQKAKDRPKEYTAIQRIGDLLLAKTREMAPRATAREFLEALVSTTGSLVETRWKEEQILDFQNGVKVRQAELTPNAEERIRLEMDRASFLAEHKRLQAADGVWASLDRSIATLPEGAARLKAEAARAGYLERAKGGPVAAAEWRRLSARYPWSLGLLEDRLAFLNRNDMGEEARNLLEAVAPKAAAGHREAFLERLTQESLVASELPRARRAVSSLLAEGTLEDARRLSALHLLARLSYRENGAWDPMPLAKGELPKLKPESHADLFHELARAADLESAWGSALGLWIEALNRRTERDWLQSAGRSAQRAHRGEELLGFFEKQHQRSPRDVRWAVAVRDIKRAFHQVEGAIEAAKSAVAVRPEKENLWREASELLVLADRIQDAADYLEGWNRPRPADEGVARWRSELYARAGQGERALAIEQGALEAYVRETADNPVEAADRRARACQRLMEYGFPGLALRLYSPTGDITALAGSRLGADRQCVLALLTSQYVRLLNKRSGDATFLQTAASVLRNQGRPEQKEEVRTFLLKQLGKPDSHLLTRWWPFLGGSGLEPSVRLGMAEKYLAAQPGPWQGQAPLAFLEALGAELVVPRTDFQGKPILVFQQPDLSRLWVRDLVRRDRPEALLTFLEPQWQGLLAQVKGTGRLDAKTERLPWTAWLDDAAILQAWARAASTHPNKARELAEIMGDRWHWDRFWVLAARHWQTTPLVTLLSQESRTAWFRFWGSQAPVDPILLARNLQVESATLALGALVQGRPGAAEHPLIVKLRGPQTVGEVLGHSGQWVWSEFALRRNAKGDLLEEGDHRVLGSGVDEGRVPGALWGERPGEAWYVLETLARYRKGDRSAPLVPLDVPGRGTETDRTLLAIRLARALKELPLALELDETHPGSLRDRRRLEARISLLLAAHRGDEAQETWEDFLLQAQARLTVEEFRWHVALAEEHDLPSPLESLDPEKPVAPAFLAYLVDRRLEGAEQFHTSDPAGFKAALAQRWRRREAQLSPEQIRYWIHELWTVDSVPLPLRGLSKLGGAWPYAGEWLQRQPPSERKAALIALEEVLNPAVARPRLFVRLALDTADDVPRLLALRCHLLRGERDQALGLVDRMLEDLGQGRSLGLAHGYPEAESPEEGEEREEAPVPTFTAHDALVNRMLIWLKPFRDVQGAEAVEARFRRVLKERREEGAVSIPSWRLAFQLTPAMERAALAEELDQAWFRGEVAPEQLGSLCEILATALPGETPRWLARWPQSRGFAQARQRAAILVSLKQPSEAAQVIFDCRQRSLWSLGEETQAFDFWRRLGTPQPKAPGTWSAALPYWVTKPNPTTPDLGDRLKAHPFDLLSARSALRSPAPATEDPLLRVSIALGETFRSDDRSLLSLRTARGLLPSSWRAARTALGSLGLEELNRVMVDRKLKSADISAALADLARVASQGGDEVQVKTALGLLSERKAPNLKALRAELALRPSLHPETFQVVDGRPTPIRPRDLTWSLLAQILKTEGVR